LEDEKLRRPRQIWMEKAMKIISSSATLAREHFGMPLRFFDPRAFIRTLLALPCLLFILLPVLASAQIPPPIISSLSPASIEVGSGGFTLTVKGGSFVSSSVIRWNDNNRATTYVSRYELRASISPSDIATTGYAAISVVNPPANGGVSPPRILVIVNPMPTIESLQPSVTAGGPGFTLSINGTGFVILSQVRWNGSSRTTTYVSKAELRANIPASDIALGGSPCIEVINPMPGGGTSVCKSLQINNSVPTITSLEPAEVTARSTAVLLKVRGTGFVAQSQVRWEGPPTSSQGPQVPTKVTLRTTVLSGSQLEAFIDSAFIHFGGTATITVLNPAPGGGVSGTLSFTIRQPTPVIQSIEPTSVSAGATEFTLKVSGSGFAQTASKVRWNGADLPTNTTGSEGGILTAAVNSSGIASGGSVSVTVFNPSPGGGTSAVKTLTINNPLPATTSLEPASIRSGSSSFMLVVNGSHFVPSSRVRWNDADRPTTFVSSTRLTTLISAQDIERTSPPADRTATVTVFNPAPQGGTSNSLRFSIAKQE
jgi:hypothetical protein